MAGTKAGKKAARWARCWAATMGDRKAAYWDTLRVGQLGLQTADNLVQNWADSKAHRWADCWVAV